MARLGAHVSSAGGLSRAVERAIAMGAECLQVFVSSPRVWQPPAHEASEIALFRQRLADSGIAPVFIHTIYLLNFASHDEQLRARSVQSLTLALRWSERLGAKGAITHLGSAMGRDKAEAEEAVTEALAAALAEAPGEAQLVLETAAGHTIGGTLAELGRIIRHLDGHARISVCLDTAHVFAAGHDLTTEAGLETLLEEFEREIGLARLVAIHANDSKSGLGTGRDRHENIGLGFLGESTFARLLHHPALRELPFILEVPGMTGSGPDRENLEILARLAASNPSFPSPGREPSC